MLAGYDHLIDAARRLQWDAEAIDLAADVDAWPGLGDRDRALVTRLVGGFCLAERAVATELDPFVAAAPTPAARDCFAIQAGDEARHARFFERAAAEVLRREPAALAAQAGPELHELFAVRLPAAARALAGDATALRDAVGLYHLVLEGIVFGVGQDALLAIAGPAGLRGIADGTARVQADERWHLGLGVLSLQRLAAPVDVADAVRVAAAAWGPEIATPERLSHALAAHDRRLMIAHGAGARA